MSALSASGTSDESIDLTAPSSPGTYYYGACVNSVTGESDTSNNCSSAVTIAVGVPPAPDLVVGLPSVSNSSPLTGASFTLSATVRNQGSGPSAATTLRYYRSTDARITTGDTQVGTDAVGALSASGTSDESIGLTAPASAGTYYYGACVIVVTDESDTSNNCSSSVQVDVTEPPPPSTPDLVVGSPSVSNSSPLTGASFTLSATVRNQGSGPSAATTLRYYRSTDATISGTDTEVGTDAVGSLAASGTSDESIGLTAPSSPGTYYYGACVDDVTGESDTSNNCSDAVTVTVGGRPDLVVESPSVDDDSPETGESFTLSATVQQRWGRGASAATTLRYYRSADATITTRRHAGGHGRGGRPVGVRNQRRVDRFDRPLERGHVLLRRLREQRHGRERYLQQLLVVRTGGCNGASAAEHSGPGGGVAFGLQQQPAYRRVQQLHALRHDVRNQGSGPSASRDDAALLPVGVTRRSADATRATGTDTEVGTDAVGSLAASGTSDESIDLTAPSSPGTYYYGACVDDVTGESDTSNNCSSSVQVDVTEPPPPSTPDLVVESPSVSNSSPVAGASFTLSATVRNQGSAPSAATTLRYYRSTDATISGTDTEVGTDAVGSLAASGTSDESIGLTAPASVGTYYYGACVNSVTGESDTSNNCSDAVTVTVGGRPDLVVESPSVDDDSPLTGASFTLSATVRNQGSGPSAATTLRYYRSARDDLGHRHAGGHGRGGRPGGIRNQRRVDRFDRPLEPRHVLLRGVRGRCHGRERYLQQLLVVRTGRRNGASATEHSRSGRRIHTGLQQQPVYRRVVQALGHRAQPGQRAVGSDDAALLPHDDLGHRYGGGHGRGGLACGLRDQRRVDRFDRPPSSPARTTTAPAWTR